MTKDTDSQEALLGTYSNDSAGGEKIDTSSQNIYSVEKLLCHYEEDVT